MFPLFACFFYLSRFGDLPLQIHNYAIKKRQKRNDQLLVAVCGPQMYVLKFPKACSDLVPVPRHSARALKWTLLRHASALN